MTSHFQISLGLQVVRERSEFSSQDLAISAELPPDEVTRIEAGEIRLDCLTAAGLIQVLRVSLAEIAAVAHAFDPAMVKNRYAQMIAHSRISPPSGCNHRAQSLGRTRKKTDSVELP